MVPRFAFLKPRPRSMDTLSSEDALPCVRSGKARLRADVSIMYSVSGGDGRRYFRALVRSSGSFGVGWSNCCVDIEASFVGSKFGSDGGLCE